MQLKDYQKRAVETLIKYTKSLLTNDLVEDKICIFKAPTGSGKTITMAEFIKRVTADEEFDLCFIWLSIGKGGLLVQSMEKLKKYFNGFPNCYLAKDLERQGNVYKIGRNEVLGISWEEIRNKNRETGEWENVIMRDGEYINLREILANTKAERRIILIIDESHYANKTIRASELKEIISPDVIIEVSATPVIKGTYKPIEVPVDEVIAEGMIKKEIILNQGIEDLTEDEMTSQEIILQAAVQKREDLKRLYEQEGVNINPLCLIQVPNGEAGDIKIKEVEEFLAGYGVTRENGRLAVWLSNEKINLDDLSKNDNPTEFLIFKVAIDTGWDCPRAQILVKLRDVKSEVLETQILGRILRMPEQRHYEAEALNKAYVYINFDDPKIDDKDYIPPKILNFNRSVLKKDIGNISLLSYYKENRQKYDIKGTDFYRVLYEVFKTKHSLTDIALSNAEILQKAGFNFDLNYRHKVSKETSIGIDVNTKKIETDEYLLKKSNSDILIELNTRLSEYTAGFDSKEAVNVIREQIYRLFAELFGISNVLYAQVLFLNNYDAFFKTVLSDAVERYKVARKEIIKKSVKEHCNTFELPNELYCSIETHEKVSYSRYAYVPCYVQKDRSSVERSLSEFLDSNDKVLFWVKNGDSGKENFGIKYEYNDEIHAFYPDFIVALKNGRIGLFETKDKNDPERETVTKAKAKALQEYIEAENRKGKNLFGGIVIEVRPCILKLNQKKELQWERLEDWEDLRL